MPRKSGKKKPRAPKASCSMITRPSWLGGLFIPVLKLRENRELPLEVAHESNRRNDAEVVSIENLS